MRPSLLVCLGHCEFEEADESVLGAPAPRSSPNKWAKRSPAQSGRFEGIV
jgi:hypothetical protein